MYYNNILYKEDLKSVLLSNIEFEKLRGRNVLVTGASGMIGSFLVDVLMLCNELFFYDINVFAMGRNEGSLKKRFLTHSMNPLFYVVLQDVNSPLTCNYDFDYIVHAASNAHPQVFSDDPIGTIMANVWGVYNIMEYARLRRVERFLFISSGEVYGQGKEGVKAFVESYSGYIDNTSPRSCYPNGKRVAETLCASYNQQYGIDTLIARPCHIYGPTATLKDSRASSHFINEVISGNDILMKSQGEQRRSYCYIADCVSGILTILLSGETGNAYNIANPNSNITIREMAEKIAIYSGKNLNFAIHNDVENYSNNPVTQSILDSRKLEGLGWEAKFDMKTGLARTIEISRGIRSESIDG